MPSMYYSEAHYDSGNNRLFIGVRKSQPPGIGGILELTLLETMETGSDEVRISQSFFGSNRYDLEGMKAEALRWVKEDNSLPSTFRSELTRLIETVVRETPYDELWRDRDED
ncbi:hypothetical protein AB1L42_19265 [Thalassoglobus sp. JC818]|uniref:hypothetical protein n=1 Tax=Thalassoglobus sp. JC818 TaxID=3232136 RepID=UPI00345A081D